MTSTLLNWLTWTIDRTSHAFRAYVVEPSCYDLINHAALLAAVLDFFSPPVEYVFNDGHRAGTAPKTPPRFDLLTFPEAFLPASALIEILQSLSEYPMPTGCIHVGLSASNDPAHPFFELDQLSKLISEIRARMDSRDAEADLSQLDAWLAMNQTCEDPLNVGCMFMVDANRRLRVCIQLKNVPSQYEAGLLHDKRVAEARFSTLVTLNPRDNRLPSVVVQPLICSDVLELDTSEQGVHPISVLTNGSNLLQCRPPDHIDVVSVAVCTPQAPLGVPSRLRWREEFLSAFVKAAKNQDWRRHQYALFVLANYLVPPKGIGKASRVIDDTTAGLSGVFIPSSYEPGPHQEPVLIDMYARPYHKVNREEDWMTSEQFSEDAKNMPTHPLPRTIPAPLLGSIVMLKPPERKSIRPSANLLTVAIDHLPRHANRWQRSGRLSGLKVYPIQVKP